MKRIAVFASGSGSNAEKIMQYFKDRPDVEVSLILANNPRAGVHQRAALYNVPTLTFDRPMLYESDSVLQTLLDHQIDYIILAGFLWLIPDNLLKHFPDKIINIHPALLPKYGGKGMYGAHVHQAVVDNAETESGITIHYVNEKYDEGQIIFQTRCPLEKNDTPERVAKKVLALEHKYFPEIIDQVISQSDKQ